ncbi:venom allergen 5-like [Anopheles stephensi]|uniref:SCP domain-containing protein n=1 Tax=Anopheles stephensi TaxID=30069 RepID=A0A182YP80_ANOST|nr:venom allergen 5-like [Anopheles stephensi]
MASWIFVAIASCLVSGLQAQIDYCTTSYCTAGVKNVGCNPPETPGGPECNGKNPAVVEITPALQTLILSEHNTRRSKLALGQLDLFLPAIRMPTISWDEELAKQAGNNARSCKIGRDGCRNTAVYAWAGQNVALSQFYGVTKTTEELLRESIDAWWSERYVTTQAQLNSYPQGSAATTIGYFTQMVNDQTDKLGCAMQYLLDGEFQTYYTVCNYAVANIAERPVYKNGPAGSGCTTGRNPTTVLNGLCSTAETINPVPN